MRHFDLTWKVSSPETTPATSGSPSTILQVSVWALLQKRCEHTFRICPSPLCLLLQPQRIQTRIPSPATRPTQALPTHDLDLALEHRARLLTEVDRFLDPLAVRAGDVHTARRDQGHTHDPYLHEEGVAASLVPPALLDEVIVTPVRAVRDLQPPVMARAELVAPLTRLEADLARRHDKYVGHHLQLKMDEAAHMISRVDPLLLRESGRDRTLVAQHLEADRAEMPGLALIGAIAHLSVTGHEIRLSSTAVRLHTTHDPHHQGGLILRACHLHLRATDVSLHTRRRLARHVVEETGR